jgi:hypothetical protein
MYVCVSLSGLAGRKWPERFTSAGRKNIFGHWILLYSHNNVLRGGSLVTTLQEHLIKLKRKQQHNNLIREAILINIIKQISEL